MGYELYEGPEGLAQIADAWESLERRTPCYVFQTVAYARMWQENVGDGSKAKPLIVALREGDEVVAIFPACRVPRRGYALLTWLGGPTLLDYGDILFDAAAAQTSAEEFVGKALDMLRRSARSAFLYLPNVREDALASDALRSQLRVYKRTAAPYIPIEGDWEGYVSSLGQRARRHVRQRERRLADLGDVEFRILTPGSAEIEPAMKRLIALKKARYGGPLARTNLFDDRTVRYRTVQASREPHGRMATLSLNGVVIAVSLMAVYRDRMYCLITAFDPEFAKYSPGGVHMARIIHTCFDEGLDPCDLCLGNEADKYHWTKLDVPLASYVSGGATGAIVCWAAGTVRRVFYGARNESDEQAADRARER